MPHTRQPHARFLAARAQTVHRGKLVGVDLVRAGVDIDGGELPFIFGPNAWFDLALVQLISAPRDLCLAVLASPHL